MLRSKLENLLQYDKALLRKVNSKINHSIKGTLHQHRRGKYTSFSIYIPRNGNTPWTEHYLSKADTATIRKYCENDYFLQLKSTLEEEIALLENFLGKFNPERKHTLSKELSTSFNHPLLNLAKTIEEIAAEWEKAEYQRNNMPFENNIFYQTKNGELVRSRAEYIIANALFDAGLHYRYECRLKLSNGKVVYPDFTVMHPKTGEIYYIEFFGMMDKADYARNNFQKIQDYANDPVFSHFIPIFDFQPDAPFTSQTVNAIIQSVFLS